MGLRLTFSQELVRLQYRKIGSILLQPDKICRQVIAVDETVKQSSVSGQFLFSRSAIDVEDKIRGFSIESFFHKRRIRFDSLLEGCSQIRPLILVDHGSWYPSASEHLGLRYKQEVTFGNRNPVESWLSLFKGKPENRSTTDFHSFQR